MKEVSPCCSEPPMRMKNCAEIRAFAESEVKPQAFLMDKENGFPAEAVKKMGELGYMELPYLKEYGGAGLDVLSYAIAVEELSRVDGGTGVILSAHGALARGHGHL